MKHKKTRSLNLVAGAFRPETAVAKIYEALTEKPRTWKDLKKLAGKADVRARVYRLRAAGKKTKPGWKIDIGEDKVRLLTGKKAA